MKVEAKLSFHVTAKLYTDKDVPFPRKSPLLVLSSTASAQEGLGGYGAPDEIEVSGEEAMKTLTELLGNLQST
jgi:hypothetical protein